MKLTQSIVCHYHKTPIEVNHSRESFQVYCPKCIEQFGKNIAPPNAKRNNKMKHYQDIEYENGDVCKFVLPIVEAFNKEKAPVKNCWCGLDVCEAHIQKVSHGGGKDRGTISLTSEAEANRVVNELKDKDAKDPKGEGWKIRCYSAFCTFSLKNRYYVDVEKADLEEREKAAAYQRDKDHQKKIREWANS